MGRKLGKFIKNLVKKVWRMNRSAKGLLIVTTNLDGFILLNWRRFAKFNKPSTRQTKHIFYTVHNIYYATHLYV